MLYYNAGVRADMDLKVLFFSFFLSICGTNAARILAIMPMKAKSHFYFHEVLFRSLVSAGHEVILINPYSLKQPIENFTIISPPDDQIENPFTGIAAKDVNTVKRFIGVIDVVHEDCEKVLKIPYIENLLKSREKIVDVLFIELFFMYKCYLPIAEKLDIPVIGTFSGYAIIPVDQAIGNPRNLATIPFETSPFGTKMSFFQRIQNVFFHTIYYLTDTFLFEAKTNEFFAKYHPDFSNNKTKVSLVFLNSHPCLAPRPVAPNNIHIGGIHLALNEEQHLSKDLQKFIDEAPHGVILFSLGSIVSGNALSPAFRQTLRETFAEIPQRVIWKFDEEVPGLSDNVLVSKWLPQKKILAHPNVVAFISHCGLMSTYEAIYSGKPLIMAPVFADQPTVATRLLELNVGVMMDILSINKEKLLELVHEIVHNQKYRDNMRNLSAAMKDNPMTQSETVVYWTNYVLRHNGAPHLRTIGADMPWYQYLLLDVIFFIIAMAIVVLFVLFYSIKIICHLFKSLRKQGVMKADKKTK